MIQVAAPVEPVPSRFRDISDPPEGDLETPERNLILDPIGSSDRTWQFTPATQNSLVRQTFIPNFGSFSYTVLVHFCLYCPFVSLFVTVLILEMGRPSSIPLSLVLDHFKVCKLAPDKDFMWKRKRCLSFTETTDPLSM